MIVRWVFADSSGIRVMSAQTHRSSLYTLLIQPTRNPSIWAIYANILVDWLIGYWTCNRDRICYKFYLAQVSFMNYYRVTMLNQTILFVMPLTCPRLSLLHIPVYFRRRGTKISTSRPMVTEVPLITYGIGHCQFTGHPFVIRLRPSGGKLPATVARFDLPVAS
jgi:hypothetical protein